MIVPQIDLVPMAAVRGHLTDTSEKLTLVFSNLRAFDEEVGALAAGVARLPLSEAAARVSQVATAAAAAASRVLRAAEIAKTVAGKASAAVTAAREAKEAAEKEAEAAADAAAAAAQRASAAARKAAAAAATAAALEVKIQPSASSDNTCVRSFGGLTLPPFQVR